MNLTVKSEPRGHRTMPSEFQIGHWGPEMGMRRLMHAQATVQSRGGPVEWSGERGMAGLGWLRGLGQDPVTFTGNDPIPVDVPGTQPQVDVPPVIDIPAGGDTQASVSADLAALQNWNPAMVTPTAAQVTALENVSGLNVSQTAPATSNPGAPPAGLEWATVVNQANQGLLKILVASKPGTYMQTLPNGMQILYSQPQGAGNLPGLFGNVAGAGGSGSFQTPLGSATFTGVMPWVIGAAVLFFFMAQQRR